MFSPQPAAQAAEALPNTTSPPSNDDSAPVFVSNNPKSHILPPDQDPKVRINPEAPGPFIAMVTASQNKDEPLADAYADQYVRYLLNLMFQVRRETQRIGEALIRNGVIDEESWVGVEQFLDYQFAGAREATASLVKPTHEEAMKRISPDREYRADIYYFFTLNCSYCREMAPDVERLWRAVKNDDRVRMVALTLGPQPQAWIDSYREYTGLTLPIKNGEELARAFRIKFAPALVVVSPTSKTAYLKTGEQSFDRMYEFVRTVQGLETMPTPQTAKLKSERIGSLELLKAGLRTENPAVMQSKAERNSSRGSAANSSGYGLERF